MPEQTRLAARAQGRKHGDDLVAALSMTLPGTLEDLARTVSAGGPLRLLVANNGLATAFAGFVQVDLIIFPLRGGVLIWDSQPLVTPFSFWRRARRGELLAPGTVVQATLSGPPQYPESAIDTSTLALPSRSVDRTYMPLPPMAIGASVEVDVVTPAVPASSGFQSGVWSWCLVLRIFDVAGDPRSDVTLPTPLQPPHRVKLACLHDSSA